MTWAFKPLRALALRNAAAKVRTLLVQSNETLLQTAVHRALMPVSSLAFRQRLFWIFSNPRTRFWEIQEALICTNLTDHVIDIANTDLGSETARRTRPQETDYRCTKATEAGTHQRDRCTIEKLTT